MSRFANTVFDMSDMARLRAFTRLPIHGFATLPDYNRGGWRIVTFSDGPYRDLPFHFWRYRTAERMATALSAAHNDGAWIGLGGEQPSCNDPLPARTVART